MHIEMEEFSDVRFKQRVVIKLLIAEKFPPVEIHRRMQAVYGDQCVEVSTVRRWIRRFKDGELGFKTKTPIFKGRISKTSAALAEMY